MLGFAPPSLLVVAYVMASQALSGIAKDLTKMSSKSAVKLVVPEDDQSSLYRWVAVLTGSKNALKGVGFFLGGLLLTLFGFQAAALAMAALVLIVLIATSSLMHGYLGRPDKTAKFTQMFSNNRAVNILAAARIFLFAARDVWFVVALPFYLYSVLGWTFWQVGTLLAVWVIGYGARPGGRAALRPPPGRRPGGEPDGRTAMWLALGLAVCPAAIARGPHAERRPDARDRRRADPLRRGLRDELRSPLLPDSRLRRQRQGRDERRLLLHGQCLRAPRRHSTLGTDLPVARANRLPVDIRRVRPRGRPAVTPAAERGRTEHTTLTALADGIAFLCGASVLLSFANSLTATDCPAAARKANYLRPCVVAAVSTSYRHIETG